MRRVLFHLAFVTMLLSGMLLGAGLASAQEAQSSPADSQAFRTIISDQIKAFRSGDASRAFSYASPALKNQFQSPQFFMHMVKSAYDPVYGAKNLSFGQTRDTPLGPVQEAYVTDRNGTDWLALYSFVRDGSGNWKISACRLTQAPAFTV
ncbi:MAG: DUF4864 domain-containing protein [Rhodobacteraceae bacterium]|nr:DUF4864 domain-containing protein [Paracoccaceae bacterium]